jgi:hypothetical protein
MNPSPQSLRSSPRTPTCDIVAVPEHRRRAETLDFDAEAVNHACVSIRSGDGRNDFGRTLRRTNSAP